jgi:phosphoglycerate dehydrogenase-like enzyme
MLGAPELASMKLGALLINVGRGATIDEAALVQALRSRQIQGAALDVFAEEPLPAGHALYGLDNVILSAHVSGFLPTYDEACTTLFCENLRRFLDGRQLLNLLDRTKGY